MDGANAQAPAGQVQSWSVSAPIAIAASIGTPVLLGGAIAPVAWPGRAVAGAHLGIPLEAAGGDKHAAAGADAARPGHAADNGARQPAVAADQFDQRRVQPQIDAVQLGQGHKEPADQRLSSHILEFASD